MDTKFWIEMIGYLGSLLVLISFMMTSVYKLRVINMVGGTIFTIYALIIRSYPTALMNGCLVLINLSFLWKMLHTRKEYELVEVKPDDAYLGHFLQTCREDIEACFPGISPDPAGANQAYIINCGQEAAAVFLGEEKDGVVDIMLDYSTQRYRDFTVGAYLFEKMKDRGIRQLVYRGPVQNHEAYLDMLGFKKDGDRYVLVLAH